MFTKKKKYLASMRDGFERYWHRTSAAYAIRINFFVFYLHI